jgi:hypothetical protein
MWVFDASQAGKATEGRVLSELARLGREVITVVNKQDRLGAEELGHVRQQLRDALGERQGEPLGVSARQALEARLGGDPKGRRQSGLDALLEALEDRIFSRSRELKRAACASRLLGVLDDTLATERDATAADEARLQRLEAAGERLARVRSPMRDAVEDAVREMTAAQDRAFRQGAEEVLAFVRPRQGRFQRHGVHREDRTFLAELLERQLRSAIEACEAQLGRRLEGLLTEAIGEADELAEMLPPVQRVLAPATATFLGYQRGLLTGGTLGRFFDELLPRCPLEPEALADALGGARADPRPELRAPLLDAVEDLVSEAERARRRRRSEVELAGARLRGRVYGPLRALREVLAELTSRGSESPCGD